MVCPDDGATRQERVSEERVPAPRRMKDVLAWGPPPISPLPNQVSNMIMAAVCEAAQFADGPCLQFDTIEFWPGELARVDRVAYFRNIAGRLEPQVVLFRCDSRGLQVSLVDDDHLGADMGKPLPSFFSLVKGQVGRSLGADPENLLRIECEYRPVMLDDRIQPIVMAHEA